MRLVQQLGILARGVLALGLPEEATANIARRVALDSMPEARRAVLRVLATGEVLSTSACARSAGLDRKVARMTLEDLAAIGVVENSRQDDDDYHGSVEWRLAGDDGEIIAGVFEALHNSHGVGRNVGIYLHSSPHKRRRRTGIDTCYGGLPTLRPTSKRR